MLDALKRHWPAYLMEAAGLALFVISASLLTTLLEYPGSPVRQAIASRFWRHTLLGLGLGIYIALLVYSPWGKRSGAHINPAVTLAFFRLGKIRPWDAAFYTVAQFAGAIVAVQLMRVVIGRSYGHPAVNYVVTRPGPGGPLLAFAAEFVISFVLMLVVLVAMNSGRLEKLVGLFTGVLIALYLAVETPLSGMSLNPARTFGSALAARHWAALWLYFVAPTVAMLLAAELYLRASKRRSLAGPVYPVDAAALMPGAACPVPVRGAGAGERLRGSRG